MSIHVPSPLAFGVGYALAEAEVWLRLLGPDPDAASHVREMLHALGALCFITGCDRPHRAWGMCDTHSKQHYRLLRCDAWTVNRLAKAAS